MATVLRGKLKGKKVKLSQWCNNWVTSVNNPKPFLITSLEFTDKEMSDILTSQELGYILEAFEPEGNRFVRRKLKKCLMCNGTGFDIEMKACENCHGLGYGK